MTGDGANFRPTSTTMRSRFFASTLQFSNDWEDHAVIDAALSVRKGDSVLMVAGAGCNVLACLLREPRSIEAVDVSDPQIALCALKLHAIKVLDRDEFLSLLGLGGSPEPVYARLRGSLPASLRSFWDNYGTAVVTGLTEAGSFEQKHHRLQSFCATQSPGARPCLRLFDHEQVAEQLAYYDRVFTEPFQREIARLYSFETVIASGRVTPLVRRYAERPDLFSRLYSTMVRRALANAPAKQNYYLRHFLTGSFGPLTDRLGPPYLRPAEFAKLKGLVDRVTLVTADLRDYVKRPPAASFDKISVSSVICYFDDAERDQVIQDVARLLRPGGRWTGTEHELSVPHRAESVGLHADEALAEQLKQMDRFPVYGRRLVEWKDGG